MLIKKVSILGFKSYKEKVSIDLTSGMNAIVGLNGSGKSNIIAAIQFALTDEYGKLPKTAKRDLLYNGKENREPSYVEIEFDNRDRRLPVDSDEVLFRRVFGLKKDVLLVNRKPVTEVKSFLQSAGFTNPYFILKQGKISNLAISSDKERLQLLKQLAGVNIYEGNRTKTEKLTNELKTCNDQVQDLLKSIEEKMEELRKEQEGISTANALDKDKRLIEFLIEQRQLEIIQSKIQDLLSQIQQCREEWELTSESKRAKLQDVEDCTTKLGNEVNSLETKLHRLGLRKSHIDGLVPELAAKLETGVGKLDRLHNDLKLARFREVAVGEGNNNEVKAQMVQNFEKCTKEYDNICAQEERMKKKFIKIDLQRKIEGKSYEFNVRERRTDWLKEELSITEETRDQYLGKFDTSDKNVKDLKTNLNKLNQSFKEVQSNIDNLIEIIKNTDKEIQNLKEEEHGLNLEQSKQWRKENHFSEKLAVKLDEEGKLLEKVQRAFGHAIVRGDEGLKKIVKEFENGTRPGQKLIASKYYGTVVESLVIESEEVSRAIEVTGGRRLMHHVVADLDTAKKLMTEFNTRKLRGEVNFIPIDTIQRHQVSSILPADKKKVKTLSDFIGRRREEVAPAFEFIFGKTLICKKEEEASALAKKYKMTCVTIDGHKFQPSGVLTGGYLNPESSKVQPFVEWQTTHLSNDEENQRIEECRRLQVEIKDRISNITNAIQSLKVTRIKNVKLIEACQKKQQATKLKLKSYSDLTTKEERNFFAIKMSLFEVQTKYELLEKESKRQFVVATITDLKKIQKLKKEVKTHASQLKTIVEKKIEKEKELNRLKRLVGEHENTNMENNGTSTPASYEVEIPEIVERKIKILQENINIWQKELEQNKILQQKILDRYSEFQEELQSLRSQYSENADQQRVLLNEISSGGPELVSLESKLELEREKLEVTKRNIEKNNNATMPSGASQYESYSTKRLYKELASIQKKLLEFKHISRVALVQYDEFEVKQAALIIKKEELENSDAKLQEIMLYLEREKRNKLIRYFGLLQSNFNVVFKSLIPNGYGSLVLYGPDFELVDISQIADDAAVDPEDLVGVKIKVSFTNERSDFQNIQNFSGGQKSLIALALILAIQKLDPVPIYLFDEVDHALDPDHRVAVARVIDEMSSEAQFICTTHRKEFLDYTKSCYGVVFTNNRSFVEKVSPEEATRFVPRSSFQNAETISIDASFFSYDTSTSEDNTSSSTIAFIPRPKTAGTTTGRRKRQLEK